jgi:hypothetical protein
MKRIIFSTLLLISGAVVFAQDRDRDQNRDNRNDNRNYNARGDVPNNVWSNFHRDYPNSNDVRWERSGRRGWHGNMRDNDNRNVDVYYDRKGRMVDRHVAWDYRNMPQGYNDRVYNRYHTRDYRVYRIERPNSSPLFELLLNLGGNSRTVYTDENGNEIRYRDRH